MYKQETLRIEGFPLYLAAYTNTDHAVKPVQLKTCHVYNPAKYQIQSSKAFR